ncbi:type IV toxin-antitoxin system AbiEi family antitoxin domain-containing protein [Micromonospora andamanensis]|uniref:type IV toxin-antitoxin system AbiEi family antitoxin domain-containing protein n=1 Tax=Micromonospora andamanensis TaxID=1287068 RepID=UPI0035E5C2D8
MFRYSELLASGWSRGRVRCRVEAGALARLSRGVYGPMTDPGPNERLAAVLTGCRRVAPWATTAARHCTGSATPAPTICT